MSRICGTPIHIVVVDPHPPQRDDLRLLLDSQPDMVVVGEAGNVAEAAHVVGVTDPDIVTLDLAAPGDSLALIERLRRHCPWTSVLVLTLFDAPDLLHAVLEAGGKGYVLKTAPAADLLEAVRAVFRGRTFVKVIPELEPDGPASLNHG